MKNNEGVLAIKNIISEVIIQVTRPNKNNKASNKRLNKNLSILGFNAEQIKDIQCSW